MKHALKSFILIGILILSYVGYQHPYSWDVTHNKNNSLNNLSIELLSKIKKPLIIDLISIDRNFSSNAQDIISLFQKENPHIILHIHPKILTPEEKKSIGVYGNHLILFTYDGRKKAVDLEDQPWNEQTFTNLIYQALQDKEHWIVFLKGHGEPDPFGDENRNLSLLTSGFQEKGVYVASLNLSEVGSIPNNTKTLVIIDTKTAMRPEEQKKILEYLDQGGNLLWLSNPDSIQSFDTLAKSLGIQWLKGTILDPKAHTLGTPHPAISIISQYADHPITRSLESLTVFPWAIPLKTIAQNTSGWQSTPILVTQPKTFLESGTKKIPGPFTIGMALQKNAQRVIVMGNSHFLSNGTIHNYGNLALANNLFNWLNHDDDLLTIPQKPAVDVFTPTPLSQTTIRYVFPYLLPLGYLYIRWRVKKSRRPKSSISIGHPL